MDEWFIIPAVLHMIFAILFLFTKKRRDISDIILSIWLFFLVLPFSGRIFGMILRSGPGQMPIFSLSTTPLTYGPFMLLYTRLIIRNKTAKITQGLFHSFYFLHFIPFIIFSFLQIIFPYAFSFNDPYRNGGLSSLELIFNIGVLLSISVYTIRTLVLLARHRKSVLNYLSYTSIQATMIWLFILVILNLANFFLLTIVDLGLIFFPVPLHGQGPLIFIYVLSFFGMRQRPIYSDTLEGNKSKSRNSDEKNNGKINTGEEPHDSEKGSKYSKSGLSDEAAEELSQQLISYMEAEQPYLDEELTIEILSQRLAIPRHYLTQVINERFNKNFFHFINEYRVLAVKNKIAQKDNDRYTILALAFDCGFNSKTTFNTAFKKIAGVTPSQYKNLVRS